MKNNSYTFLVLGVLFAGFGLFSFLVYLTKGKNKFFLKNKLAIGAMVITLTFTANGCRPVVTCYVTALDPVISSQDSLNLDRQIVISKTDRKLSFNYTTYQYNYLMYSLNHNDETIFSGDAILQKEEDKTSLFVEFPNALDTGVYKLVLYYYDEPIEDISSVLFSEQFDVKVIE